MNWTVLFHIRILCMWQSTVLPQPISRWPRGQHARLVTREPGVWSPPEAPAPRRVLAHRAGPWSPQMCGSPFLRMWSPAIVFRWPCPPAKWLARMPRNLGVCGLKAASARCQISLCNHVVDFTSSVVITFGNFWHLLLFVFIMPSVL